MDDHIVHESAASEPRKKRRRWPWITLGAVVVVLVLIFGMTGIGHIPLVSNMFGAAHPKDLGVHPTAADWTSVEAKTPLKVQGAASGFSVFGEKKYSGTVPVDNQLTSAELTAWVQHYTTTDADVSDVQVKFHDGGMEISAFAKRYVNAPIYVDVNVTRTGTNSVSLDLKKAKVGMFTVPSKYLPQVRDYLQRVLNDHLAAIPGFSMTSLTYHNGYRAFIGTYPATVTASTGTWW